MADDHNQRPYRGNDASQRLASGAAPASASDPLAELARLIGQNDPFAEFGRDGSKRAAVPQPAPSAPPQQAPLYGSPDFPRASFGSAPLAGGADLYHVDDQTTAYQQPEQPAPGYGGVPNYDVPGYGAPGYEASGFPVAPAGAAYEHDAFPPSGAQQQGLPEDDYYDDVPPNRRRIGILAIAGVFALAVIGTAGAFGYRAIFGSSSVSSPPPVIKAEQAPSKIVPAAASNTQNSKAITDRANDRGQGERLVSREETPVVVTTTQPQAAAPLGSGIVGSEPKRIRTIAIKPDQPLDGMPTPPDSIPAPTAQPRVISTTPQRAVTPAPTPAPQAMPEQAPAAPMRVANPQPAERAAPPVAQPAARAEAPPPNAPLSLNPNAPNAAPARAAPPQRAAAIAPPPPAATSGSGGGYAVQVSAQRSEEEAQAAFRSLQGKFPGQLGNRQPLIKRVDLGDKGIFFRAMVGPFGDSAQANQMCASLKSAGGSCLVQKN
ncbi:MAG: SPOR domain-containing protein [Pseudolabrys sp.]|nr:SPOR domain-containing protein [Pseudolabrys sp.]MDP2294231.1 SPOR domain-containing protein [Pseudolabrys sp.]